MLEARNVSYTVAGRTILDGVDLVVRPGETVAVVGPNGAGKSTLLKLLCGCGFAPTAGEINLDNRPISAYGPRRLARRRAVLPQEQELRAGFCAFDVVLLGRSPHVEGRETDDDYRIAAAALEEVRGTGLGGVNYTVLSGGEKQRVALARGAAQIWESVPDGARYYFLDEPTNNLDLEHKHRLLKTVSSWARSGMGVLLVLHDLNLAAQYADQLVVLHEGRRVAAGRPGDVLTTELMRDVFRTEACIVHDPHVGRPVVLTTGAVDTAPFPRPDKQSLVFEKGDI